MALPWINDFTNADSDTYFQQLSQFLASNPQGTIDVKAFENSANPTDFLKTFPPVGSEGSSPESSSNASHTYADPANIIVPTSGDSNTRNSSRQASADSSDFDQRGKNKNGKRANGETSKKAALKDKKRSASTETGEDAVHHSHEQEQEDAEKKGNGKKKGSMSTSDKRKEQNRNAQRAFRDRKEQHARTLEKQVAELEAAAENREAENRNLKELVARLQNENAQLSNIGDTKFTFSAPVSKSLASSMPASSASIPVSLTFPSIQRLQPTSPPVPSSALQPFVSSATSFFDSPTNGLPESSASMDDLLASEPLFTPSGEHFNFASFSTMPASSASFFDTQPADALSPNSSANLFQAYREPSVDPLSATTDWTISSSDWANSIDAFSNPASTFDLNSNHSGESPMSVPSLTSASSSSSVSSVGQTGEDCPVKPMLKQIPGAENWDLDSLCADMALKATCQEVFTVAAQKAIKDNQHIDDFFGSFGHERDFSEMYRRDK